MKTRAAVLVELGRPLVLADIEVPALKAGQVLVEIGLTGVCHTQLLEARGRRGPDAWLPHLLGHEAVGTVLEAGPGTSRVKAGQRVVLSWMKAGGAEAGGAVYTWDGKKVNSGGVTTFQRHAVVSENRLTPLPAGLDPRVGALLGCAVPTGFGMVFNALQLKAGQTVAVFGLGGIGLCAVAAAGGGRGDVVGVDPRADRRAAARAAGATHDLAPGDGLAAALKALAPGGFDGAIEASGRPAVMATALDCVRQRGGTAVVAGNAPAGETLTLDPKAFNLGKRLLGTWGGDNEPDRDFPRWAALLAKADALAPLLPAPVPLSAVNAALDDLESGRALRPLLDCAA